MAQCVSRLAALALGSVLRVGGLSIGGLGIGVLGAGVLAIGALGIGGAAAAPGQEVVPPTEAHDTAIIIQALEAFVKTEHPAMRDAHAKGHGCVKGEFTVDPNVPAALRAGVFAQPRSYRAWVRFSNSSGARQPDEVGDARGLAIKLLGVDGPKVLAQEAGAQTQDFVMFNYPAFFIKDAADYVAFLTMAAQHKEQQFFDERPHQAANFKAASSRTTGVLDQRYYSVAPSLLGDQATKFSAFAVDCATGAAIAPKGGEPPKDQPDFLRHGMVEWLKAKDACFTFAVQPQTDPATQPVEDPTIEWPESKAPFIPVARLHIPKQTFDSPAQQAFCENLSFTPWHAVVAERPIGGINRIREPVYMAISNLRHRLNSAPHIEPNGTETFP